MVRHYQEGNFTIRKTQQNSVKESEEMKDHHKMRAWDGKNLWPFARYTLDGSKVEASKQENGCYNQFLPAKDCTVDLGTGLKNKKGELIYEGDSFDMDSESKGCLAQVVFRDGAFGYEYVGSKVFSRDITYLAGYGEPVGNIHENTNLLKGRK